MSPMAKTSGCPGNVQSGSTATRPARSVCAPVFAASIAASGDACTPAAQIQERARMASSTSGPCTVTEPSSMPTARVFRRISTPIFPSRFRLYRWSFGWNGPSTAPAPSSSRMRASVVSTVR